MHELGTVVWRTVALLTVLAVALGASSCGDPESSSSSMAPTMTGSDALDAPSTTDGDAPTSPGSDDSGANEDRGGTVDGSGADEKVATTDEKRITETVEAMYADLAAGNAQGVCDAMSVQARAQIAQQVPGGTADPRAQRTCTESMAKFIDVAAGAGGLESTLGATVSRVQINGNVAMVDVSFKGSQSGQIRLTKESDGWRFGPGAVGAR